MKKFFKPRKSATYRAPSCEDGYALMMVVFFTALMLVAVMVAAPRILLEGKREKEKEMIWRGHQYVRGVKLYYRKMGHFPTSIDDLTKPKTGSLRFMRQAYKDPMNGEDGSWRLIYVGPAGQLIGSLKPPQSLQLPKGGAGLGTSASSLATNSTGQSSGSSAFGSSSGFGSFGSSGANAGSSAGAAPGSGAPGAASPTGGGGSTTQPGAQQNPDSQYSQPNAQSNAQGGAPNGGQPGQPGQGVATTSPDGSQPSSTDASGAASSDAMSTPQAINPTSTSPIIGGNIIGVGSKVSARSVIVYEKAKNYHLFEFIWDPSKDTTIAGQAPLQTGTGLGQNIGTNPSTFGQQPGATNPNQGQPNTPGNSPQGTPSSVPPLDSAPAPPQQ
jgi:hypothetical protein